MDLKESKKGELKLLNYPYLVQHSENVKASIKLALERGLLDEYEINITIIENYLAEESGIPVWIAEAACEVNLRYIETPIKLQYVWFCLHNSILVRKQPSGREFRTKVNFSSCYVKCDDKLKKAIVDSCNKLGISLAKFSRLCGFKYGLLSLSKEKIQITAILKVCQILDIDIWSLLEGYELFGRNSNRGKIKIPENGKDTDIDILLIWLRTEGHLELASTHIEINQKNNIASLRELTNIAIKKFGLRRESIIFAIGKRDEDRLIISSSPFRQLICLKYNIPLGYKSGSLQQMDFNNLSKESYQSIMAAFMQTEGCLSYHYTRKKKKKLPCFEFAVKDSSLSADCVIILRKLGFEPKIYEKQNIFKVGLYNSKEVIELVKLTEQYFFNRKKIEQLRKVCTDGIGL